MSARQKKQAKFSALVEAETRVIKAIYIKAGISEISASAFAVIGVERMIREHTPPFNITRR